MKRSHFPVAIFFIVFICMALLTTTQNYILGSFSDYMKIPPQYIIIMTLYWIFVSLWLTLFIRRQILTRYEEPLQQFAKATKDVAHGDFSVYVRPLHTADKADYFDVMMEDFNKMVAELGSIETLKTEFFSNVSHEIKTPLSVIQNYAEMLLSKRLSDEQRIEYATAIMQSTKKLSQLITNILKLNKLDKQEIKPVPELYDLCVQLGECALQFEQLWEAKEIEFIADIEDSAMIESDESLMEIVWNNLLSNAFKFTNNGGTVTLTQTSTNNEIIVSVTDTGCGMSDETIDHIYDKFYQGDTSHAMEGNGLGLALSARVIQLIGGTLTVKSKLGEGTEFIVAIPTERRNDE